MNRKLRNRINGDYHANRFDERKTEKAQDDLMIIDTCPCPPIFGSRYVVMRRSEYRLRGKYAK
jgi:hypothetical protein